MQGKDLQLHHAMQRPNGTVHEALLRRREVVSRAAVLGPLLQNQYGPLPRDVLGRALNRATIVGGARLGYCAATLERWPSG